MRTSRRSLLAAGAAVGAGAGLAALPSAARATSPTTPATTAEEVRVLVIGSGFGGGVTALRLAQAGVPVTVLERGRRWETGPDAETFPHASSPDKRLLWYGTTPEAARPLQQLLGKPIDMTPYVGLVEPVLGVNMLAMCAAGLGGGSLVYQGMTLQPAKDVFNELLPEQLDYVQMDATYYPRVARMLQVETAPDELIDSPTYLAPRTFKKRAERAGYTVEKIPMPIDWTYALDEVAGEMKPSYTNGDCAMGVNNGGKHSVDVTYIKQAEATGLVDVRIQHNVTRIEQAGDGRWTVYADRTDEAGTVLEHVVITAKSLVMAAGSLNTSKLLLKAKADGAMPSLPDGIGEGWGTNGDRIYAWTDLQTDFGAAQGGPVIYGSKEWADPSVANTIIQASLPPMQGLDTHTTMLVGFGASQGRGRFLHDALTGEVTLHWPKLGDQQVHTRIAERLARVVGLTGGLIDTYAIVPSTWHPLGGANMGTVCDLEGRVKGNPGLYVLDGALIPGSTGACNPSMTIAAVAERALDRIVKDDVGTLI
ncbi:MAG: GMC family oxidoreductase [Nocardioides sp.]|nr:GMC family oxidoreductase [Nocardioides sp.]